MASLPHRNVTDPPRLRKPGRRESVAARQHEALTYRRAGVGFRQIGEKLGVSAMQAHRDVRAALRLAIEQTRASAAEHIALELVRLDALLLGVWRRATDGDPQAAIAALRVCESRRRLLGLDAEAYVGLLVPAAPGEDLSAVPLAQLRERLALAMRTIDAEAVRPARTSDPQPVLDVAPVGVPLPTPDPGTREARLLAYERELAARRNGGPH